MQSIAIYIMANTKQALAVKKAGTTAAPDLRVRNAIKKIASQVLMTLRLPTGKTLGESTGAECRRCGGWLAKVGDRVGPRGIVGKKLNEQQLRAMWEAK